ARASAASSACDTRIEVMAAAAASGATAPPGWRLAGTAQGPRDRDDALAIYHRVQPAAATPAR
ncbi:MAG: hypothetical protein KGI35_15660, partial [Burkholderiales bacterium]|nr:hypothetical protein [Burkholderiales bacterium]